MEKDVASVYLRKTNPPNCPPTEDTMEPNTPLASSMEVQSAATLVPNALWALLSLSFRNS